MGNSGHQITLWDSESPLPEGCDLTYRWNGLDETEQVRSLLRYVETHGERLRRRYIAWIHELGEHRIRGKRLIDHFAFEDGLSYWWMTLFVEQSHYKSPSIMDAIRLLALEEILVQQRPVEFRLVSSNQQLHETMHGLCRRLNINYRREKICPQRRVSFLRAAAGLAPKSARALINLLFQCRTRWPLRRAEKPGWFGGNHSLFICTYFFNIESEQARDGCFHSRYWESLHRLLQNMDFRINWLQRYIRHETVPPPRTALEWIRVFNRNAGKEGFHSFLDAYLSWSIVLRVLGRWLRLIVLSFRVRPTEQDMALQGSPLSLWPLMRGDWLESLRGPVAIDNLLEIELFDAALRDLPYQRRGLFLCENQAWERALIHAWRKNSHGQLIGVVHSTVRFWDLRYFVDPRTISSCDPHPMPRADRLALNGKAAFNAYLSADYPREALVECEALRFGYMSDLRPPRRNKKNGEKYTASVLILGDYGPSSTITMLRLLESSLPLMLESAAYSMKPHPNFPIKASDYPSLNLTVISEPLPGILGNYDIAYSCNTTSAAVDAYLAGLPVVVLLEATALNLSPLRAKPGVRFAGTPAELASALQSAMHDEIRRPDLDEFFFLDPALPRWRRLLSTAMAAANTNDLSRRNS